LDTLSLGTTSYNCPNETPRQARQGLSAYFPFYNDRRLPQSLDYQTPAEVYLAPPLPASAPLLTAKEHEY